MRILFWTLLLFVMWLILTSSLHVENLVIGLVISLSIAIFYTKIFTFNKFEMIHPFWLFMYLVVLVKNLIISNMQIAKRTLSKDLRLSPAIIAVKTDLKSDWKKLLLANSITLTPGTLTLDIKDDVLFIHVIECKGDKKLITKEFEDIIAKI